jgi:hypothetical protein
MKSLIMAAASGLALSAFVMASPAFAQGSYPTPSGSRVDANGMPTTHSTPTEKAQTADLNGQVAATDGEPAPASPASTAANDAQYQAQQQQYQQQQQQYQDQMQKHQAQQDNYANRTAMYEDLRMRYAAERAAYHRDLWPDREHWVVLEHDANLIGERVELISGNRVGTVIDTAHSAGGNVEALLVRLDSDKVVWIDSQDVRFNRADGIVMTDLRGDDLRHMADERL